MRTGSIELAATSWCIVVRRGQEVAKTANSTELRPGGTLAVGAEQSRPSFSLPSREAAEDSFGAPPWSSKNRGDGPPRHRATETPRHVFGKNITGVSANLVSREIASRNYPGKPGVYGEGIGLQSGSESWPT